MFRTIAAFIVVALAALAQDASPAPAWPEAEQQELRNALQQTSNSAQDIVRVLEAHLAKYPNTVKRPEMEQAIAKAAIDLKDERRIAIYGRKVLARTPDDTQLLDQVCRALLRMGDPDSLRAALEYALQFQKVLAASKDDGSSGAERARKREQLDTNMSRALLFEGQARGGLGDAEAAAKLARRSFDAYPSAIPAMEEAVWLGRLNRPADAVQALADAFTVPDPKTTDADRAKYRIRLGEAYVKWKGSEAGLGDIVLAAFDRNAARVAERQMALRKFDPNLGLANPMEFTLTGVEGDRLSLASLAGKVIVLDFWATWCGPCRLQHPLYDEVKKRFSKDSSVVFLAISTDEDRDLVKPFLEAQKWSTRAYYEDGLSQTLRIASIPTTIILDRRGGISTRMNGFDPETFVATLTERINEALK
jgi:thiol-disulfide isomerase/thioredoxin